MSASESHNVFIFGDQAGPWEDGLSKLLRRKSNDVLISFHEQAFFCLRREIGSLRRPQYNSFARFSSLKELLDSYREASPSKKHPALAGSLCSLYHLSCFFRYDFLKSRPVTL